MSAGAALWQWLAVAAIVAVCAVRAVWQLAPARLRRRGAKRLVRAAPAFAAWSTVRKAAQAPVAGGCGCDGCDKGQPAAPPAAGTFTPATNVRKVIRIAVR